MKEKFISKVEVIDTGKPTLFCRCPVEFCGRLIDIDDRTHDTDSSRRLPYTKRTVVKLNTTIG